MPAVSCSADFIVLLMSTLLGSHRLTDVCIYIYICYLVVKPA